MLTNEQIVEAGMRFDAIDGSEKYEHLIKSMGWEGLPPQMEELFRAGYIMGFIEAVKMLRDAVEDENDLARLL